MKNPNAPCQKYLESQYGYVATAATAWNEKCDLRYAIDPRARMSMRLVDYHTPGWNARSMYASRQDSIWCDVTRRAKFTFHAIDETVTPPDVYDARCALYELLHVTIAETYYVAGFQVDQDGALHVLLGYATDVLEVEDPCKLYMTATINYPSSGELHLRFTPSDKQFLVPGQPLFRDVHMRRDKHGREDIRVREYYFPKSGTLGLRDARDLMFAKLKDGSVTAARYSDIEPRAEINFSDL